MKNTIKYTFLSALFLGFAACDVDNTLPEIKAEAEVENNIALSAGSVDFSKYIAVGGSFTAGYTDGALFRAGQGNSFPNILASKFAMVGGGDFNQPLMEDNIGGMIHPVTGDVVLDPRYYFDTSTGLPTGLDKTPTTIAGYPATNAASFSNYGIPGVKSFHFLAPGYGNPAGLQAEPATANPYFVRMSPTQSTLLAEIASKQPTFFTLSEIGGNDVLDYAVAGGAAGEITPQSVFEQVFGAIINTLAPTSDAKGVVANLPYITTLPHFTTVPYAPLDPTADTEAAAALAAQIPTLNLVYGALNQIFTNPQINQPNRVIQFSATSANPVVIKDENLADLSGTITAILGDPQNTAFIGFIQTLGLPAESAPLVAQLLGQQYGQARQATANDLLVLPSSGIIGTVNKAAAADLITKSGGLLPASLAGQFSAEGVTLPLENKWVLTPEEQAEIKTATDGYNATIKAMAEAKGLAFVDLKALLEKASTASLEFDNYNMNASLVTGGLVSLDGIHLTARGYALMANQMLLAIDKTYGSNFKDAKDGLAKAVDYPTNYSPMLQ
ncbi:G-D-S-L family lipolytic protein [Tenacibaculum larymnensis]|uniref:G-D-S-L family lipolytic protein n=1 Tax=Tenacibaculum larymnensis TaxID=2878201 RepID=A0A9X4ENS6_9FLAO|nr:G-D-S-L family lipolytic protein [Tenacibaculum larymnensis]MDE1205350.1 G-D-S-L family lipolytic protein [Tenacibaculum larymnensis]